ncbi:MAG: PKD domain-containing protein [Gammaproteobacteria bacterium]|nr:PKD domain-containing protein [Gammaproteobacteria bacterium]
MAIDACSDNTAPTATAAATPASSQTATAGAISFTASEAGTAFVVLLPASDTAPSSSDVSTHVARVEEDVEAGAASVSVSSRTRDDGSALTADTAYAAYIVIRDETGNLSEVTKVDITTGAVATADTTAPTVSAVTVDGIAALGATFNLTSDEAGDVFILTLPSSATAPTSIDEIIAPAANDDSDEDNDVSHVRVDLTATTATAVAILDLDPGTAHIAYYVVIDVAGNPTAMEKTSEFTTLELAAFLAPAMDELDLTIGSETEAEVDITFENIPGTALLPQDGTTPGCQATGLPAGLSIDQVDQEGGGKTCQITGTVTQPTYDGPVIATVTATSAGGSSSTNVFFDVQASKSESHASIFIDEADLADEAPEGYGAGVYVFEGSFMNNLFSTPFTFEDTPTDEAAKHDESGGQVRATIKSSGQGNRGQVIEFTAGTENKVLFGIGEDLSTAEANVDLSRFEGGLLVFDVRIINRPTEASAVYNFKVDFGAGNMKTDDLRVGGISDLGVNEWQTITVDLSDPVLAAVDWSNVDAISIFPEWTKAAGTTLQLDRIVFYPPSATTAPVLANIDASQNLHVGFEAYIEFANSGGGAISACALAADTSLPAGLTIGATDDDEASTCVITGTPSGTSASATYSVTATNSVGAAATAATVTLAVTNPIVEGNFNVIDSTGEVAPNNIVIANFPAELNLQGALVTNFDPKFTENTDGENAAEDNSSAKMQFSVDATNGEVTVVVTNDTENHAFFTTLFTEDLDSGREAIGDLTRFAGGQIVFELQSADWGAYGASGTTNGFIAKVDHFFGGTTFCDCNVALDVSGIAPNVWKEFSLPLTDLVANNSLNLAKIKTGLVIWPTLSLQSSKTAEEADITTNPITFKIRNVRWEPAAATPALADAAAVTIPVSEPITPIVFVNNGGAPKAEAGCTSANLPEGLSVSATAGSETVTASCQVTGTPALSLVGDTVNVVVTATGTNDITSSASVAITFSDDATAPTVTAASSNLSGEAVSIDVTSNEAGTGYVLVLPRATTAPSSTDVRTMAQAAASSTATGAVAANVATSIPVRGLTVGTMYTAYAVAADAATNLSTPPTAVEFETTATADETAPTVTAPSVSAVMATAATLNLTSNEDGAIAVVVLPTPVATTPDAAAITTPAVGTISATGSATTDVAAALTLTGLTATTQYIAYFVVTDTAGNNSEVTATQMFTTNTPPVANAGVDQTVEPTVMVTLDGSASSDTGGGAITYSWSQTAGTTVTLSDATIASPTFDATPADDAGEALTFVLTVTDTAGDTHTDEVTITVNPVLSDAEPHASITLFDSTAPAVGSAYGTGVTIFDGTFMNLYTEAFTYEDSKGEGDAGSGHSETLGQVTAMIVDSGDVARGDIIEFTTGTETKAVLGIGEDNGAVGGDADLRPYAGGLIQFDIRITDAPDDNTTVYRFGLIANNGANNEEEDLGGQKQIRLNQWYTVRVDLNHERWASLNLMDVDAIRAFPLWMKGQGTTLQLDNFIIYPRTPMPPILANFVGTPTVYSGVQTSIIFENSGGRAITACALDSGQNLPAGLTLAPTADSGTCQITGKATASSVSAQYSVTATNSEGVAVSAATVTFAVLDGLTTDGNFDVITSNGVVAPNNVVITTFEVNQATAGVNFGVSENTFGPDESAKMTYSIDSSTGAATVTITNDTTGMAFFTTLFTDTNSPSRGGDATVDLARLAEGNIVFDLQSDNWGKYGDGRVDGFVMKIDHSPFCGGCDTNLNVSDAGNTAKTFTIPVRDLVTKGLQLAIVKTGIVLWPNPSLQNEIVEGTITSNPITFTLSNVRWEPASTVETPVLTLGGSNTRSFDTGTAITPIVIDFTDGGENPVCTVEPALPQGLNLTLDAGNTSCRITGNPSAATASAVYVITVANGTQSSTVDVTIAITAPGDVTGPVLSAVTATGATDTTVTVNLTSNEAGTGYVLVSATNETLSAQDVITRVGADAVGDFVSTQTLTADVAATASITGLAANIQYFVYVVATDAATNSSIVSTGNFTTTATPDTTAPTLSQVTAMATSDTAATVSLISNEAGTGYILITARDGADTLDNAAIVARAKSPTLGDFAATPAITTPGTAVTADITGLTASTPYTAYVVAADSAGTPNNSEITTVDFETEAPADVTAPVITAFTTPSSNESSVQLEVVNDENGLLSVIILPQGTARPTMTTEVTDPQGSPISFSAQVMERTSTHTVTGLDSNTRYDAHVVLTDGSGNPSNIASRLDFATANAAPVADAGSVSTVMVGVPATLDGTGSTDDDGAITTYAWVQTTTAPGVTGTLTNANMETATFTPTAGTAAGDVVFTLTVTDNGRVVGNTSPRTDSDTVTVTVALTPDTTDPVLTSIGDSNETVNSADITFTSDESGTAYVLVQPELDGVPSVTEVKEATGDFSATGNAVADTPLTLTVSGLASRTAYAAYIVVTDGSDNDSDIEATLFGTLNAAPVASTVGTANVARTGAEVTLLGTSSTDDSMIASYAWEVTSDATDKAITLDDSTSATPKFTVDSASTGGQIVFTLTVTDDGDLADGANPLTDTATITVTVTDETAPVFTEVTPGIVVGFSSETHNSVTHTVTSNEAGPVALLTLPADDLEPDANTIKTASGDGSIKGTAVAGETLTLTVPGLDSNTRQRTYAVITDVAGNDSTVGRSAAFTTTNLAPVANAGIDQPVASDARVTLTGTATDPDSDPSTLTYAWTQTGGTTVTLTNANTATATFEASVADDAGETLTFTLTVTDTEGSPPLTATDSVSIIVMRVPLALPDLQTPDPAIFVYETNESITAITFDNDGGEELTGCAAAPVLPTGLTIERTLDNTSCTITGTAPATEVAVTTHTITATNATGPDGTPVEITITVNEPANVNPTVTIAAPTVTVTAGEALTLSGICADSDGTIESCAWAHTSGGAPPALTQVTVTATLANFIAVNAGNTAIIQVFTLTATDDDGGTDTGTITVTVDPMPLVLDSIADEQLVLSGAMLETPIDLPISVGESLIAPMCSITSTGVDVGLTIAFIASPEPLCRLSGTVTASNFEAEISVQVVDGDRISNTATVGIIGAGAPNVPDDTDITLYVNGVYGGVETPGARYSLAISHEAISQRFSSTNTCELAPGVTLPMGLTLEISSSNSVCAIVGTPTATLTAQDYALVLGNGFGETTVTLSLEVSDGFPPLFVLPSVITSLETGARIDAQLTNTNFVDLATTPEREVSEQESGGCQLVDGPVIATAMPLNMATNGLTVDAECFLRGTPINAEMTTIYVRATAINRITSISTIVIPVTEPGGSTGPTVSAVSVSDIGSTSARVSLSSSEAGNAYIFVIPVADDTLGSAPAKNIRTLATGTVVPGNVAATVVVAAANTPVTETIEGLAENTRYSVYVATEDADGTISTNVDTAEFRTPITLQVREVGQLIDPIIIEFTGNPTKDVTCAATNLPDGLDISTLNGDSCQITGTPSETTDVPTEIAFTITDASSPPAVVTGTVMILVIADLDDTSASAVSALTKFSYREGEQVRTRGENRAEDPVININSRTVATTTGEVTCTVADKPLPGGLSVEATSYGRHCYIYGTASEPASLTTYTILVKTSSASTTVEISLEVLPAELVMLELPSVVPDIRVGVDFGVINLVNTNSETMRQSEGCQLASGSNTMELLPNSMAQDGLLVGSRCTITSAVGGPIKAGLNTLYVSSRNVDGVPSISTIELTVLPALPGGSSGSSGTSEAQPPSANAGADQTVANAGGIVVIDASTSLAGDGGIAQYAWSQTSGVSVGLYGANAALASFNPADTGLNGGELSFTVTVTNSSGETATDEVVVNVLPALPSLNSPTLPHVVSAGVAIEAIVISNTGGGRLLAEAGCTASNLPEGLSVSLSTDGHTCEISGTPLAAQDSPVSISVLATNAAGTATSAAEVSLLVQ